MGFSGSELTANAAALAVSCLPLDWPARSPHASASAALAAANMRLTFVAVIDPSIRLRLNVRWNLHDDLPRTGTRFDARSRPPRSRSDWRWQCHGAPRTRCEPPADSR